MNESKSLTERTSTNLSRYYNNTKYVLAGMMIGYFTPKIIDINNTYQKQHAQNKEITIFDVTYNNLEEHKYDDLLASGVIVLSTLAVNNIRNKSKNKKTVRG